MEVKLNNKISLTNRNSKKIIFPQTIMNQTIEKTRPIKLGKEILAKRKIITNLFNKKFESYLFNIKPEALAIFEENFKNYLFHSSSPLLNEIPVLKRLFRKKKKFPTLKSKINVGQLFFCSLNSKKTKKDINEVNFKERFFGHSKNFTSNPSKDLEDYELYKVRKADEDRRNLKLYRQYSNENSSEKDDSIKKEKKYRKHSILNLSNNKAYHNNFIKIKENDDNNNNVDENKIGYMKKLFDNKINMKKNNIENKIKNKTIKEFFKNKNPLYTYRNRNNTVYHSTRFDLDKRTLNKKTVIYKFSNKERNNNSITYSNKNYNYFKNSSLINNHSNLLKLKNIKMNSINNLKNNFCNLSHSKKYYNTSRGDNSFRISNIISPIIKRNKKLEDNNKHKKLFTKKNLNIKIEGLNSYTNKCNYKLIKLIDINKSSVAKNISSMNKKNDELHVDIKELLKNKRIKIEEPPFKKKLEIEEILNEAKEIENKIEKKTQEKKHITQKRIFEKQLSKMSDDMALLMVDKFYKTEIDLSSKRDYEKEIELEEKIKKEKNEIKFSKLREKNKKFYHQITCLKAQINMEKNKIFD